MHQRTFTPAAVAAMRLGGAGALAWLAGAAKGAGGAGKALLADDPEEINAVDRYGQSALFLACERVDLAVVRALLRLPEIDVDIASR